MLDIHTDFVEPPELVRDRSSTRVEVFGDPADPRLSDWGLRSAAGTSEKLRAMVEGAAEEALNRAHASA